MKFLLGLIVGSIVLEPIIINFIYFTNVDLFIDLILTRKNYHKLVNCVFNRIEKED